MPDQTSATSNLNEQMRAELDELVRDLYNFQGGSQFATRLEKIARRQHGSAVESGTSLPVDLLAARRLIAQLRIRLKQKSKKIDDLHGERAELSMNLSAFQHGSAAQAVGLPSRAQINEWMKEAGWQNSALRQADLEGVEKVVRAALSRRPAAEQPEVTPWLETGKGKAWVADAIAAAEQPAEELTPKDVNVLRRWAEQIERIASLFDDERGLLCQQVVVLMHRIAYKPAEAAEPNGTLINEGTMPAAAGNALTGAQLDLLLSMLAQGSITVAAAKAKIEQHLRAAPQPAQGEGLTRDQIRSIFMAHGFTIKEGQTDLKDYVYAAADAIIAAHTQSDGKDAERMDFMLSNFTRCSSLDMSGNHAWSGVGRYIGRGNTARDAIDAAMQQAASNQQEGAK